MRACSRGAIASHNRLVEVKHKDDQENLLWSVEYAYDYLDRLIARTADEDGAGSNPAVTKHYVYDGDQIIMQLDDEGTVEHRYLWGPAVDLLLADEDVADETVRWALGDHQNTVRDLVE